MAPLPPPLAFFVLLFSGWVNRHQQAVIDYLLEENRVPREVNGSRRLRMTDDQRRRLAVQPLDEKHLRAAVGAFMDHYHEERPHQGLGNELIAPKTALVACPRCGGCLHMIAHMKRRP